MYMLYVNVQIHENILVWGKVKKKNLSHNKSFNENLNIPRTQPTTSREKKTNKQLKTPLVLNKLLPTTQTKYTKISPKIKKPIAKQRNPILYKSNPSNR